MATWYFTIVGRDRPQPAAAGEETVERFGTIEEDRAPLPKFLIWTYVGFSLWAIAYVVWTGIRRNGYFDGKRPCSRLGKSKRGRRSDRKKASTRTRTSSVDTLAATARAQSGDDFQRSAPAADITLRYEAARKSRHGCGQVSHGAATACQCVRRARGRRRRASARHGLGLGRFPYMDDYWRDVRRASCSSVCSSTSCRTGRHNQNDGPNPTPSIRVYYHV